MESFPQELERKLTLKVTVTEFHVVLCLFWTMRNQKVFHTVSFKRLNYEVDLEAHAVWQKKVTFSVFASVK